MTRFRQAIRVVVPALALLACFSARADDIKDFERRKCLAILSAWERVPTKADLDRVGREPDRVLVDVVEDVRLPRSIRLRAIASLGFYPTRRSRAVLMGVINARESDLPARRTALRAAAAAFQEEVIEDARAFLADANAGVREAGVRALGVISAPRVDEILATHQAHEEDVTVRDVITEILAARGRGKAPPAPRLPPGPDKEPPRAVPAPVPTVQEPPARQPEAPAGADPEPL